MPFESLRGFIKLNPYVCERNTCQERDDVRLQILLTVQSETTKVERRRVQPRHRYYFRGIAFSLFANVAVIVGRTSHGGVKQRGTSEEPMLQEAGV